MGGIWVLAKSGAMLTLVTGVNVKLQSDGSMVLVAASGAVLGHYENGLDAHKAFYKIVSAAASSVNFVDLREVE